MFCCRRLLETQKELQTERNSKYCTVSWPKMNFLFHNFAWAMNLNGNHLHAATRFSLIEDIDCWVPGDSKHSALVAQAIRLVHVSIKWLFFHRTWGLASWTWWAYGQTCPRGTLPTARTWQVTCRAPPRTPGGWTWETTAPNGNYGRGEETVWEVWKQSRKFDAKDPMGHNPNCVKKNHEVLCSE